MSRQVVKPAMSVMRALYAPCSVACPGVVFTSSSSQWTPLLVRCVWRSMRPGRSVALPRSTVRAPSGVGSAVPTASIRSPRTMTTAGASGARPVPSRSRADRMTTSGAGAVVWPARSVVPARRTHSSCFMAVHIIRRMPIGTAVHERTLRLCESLNYREWSGYYAVSVYETHHEHEYNAIRNAAALIDVTPLFKYLVTGPDATKLVNRVIARDIHKVTPGQVIYCCWCDPQGQVVDDGTISRLGENTYRWTAADPSLRWFQQNALGLDVEIEDISEQVAALALQGPTSGRLLQHVAEADIANLKYFRVTSGKIAGVPVDISRTGYAGDLGYEIWIPWNDAVRVWDTLMAEGRAFDIHPAGMIEIGRASCRERV